MYNSHRIGIDSHWGSLSCNPDIALEQRNGMIPCFIGYKLAGSPVSADPLLMCAAPRCRCCRCCTEPDVTNMREPPSAAANLRLVTNQDYLTPTSTLRTAATTPAWCPINQHPLHNISHPSQPQVRNSVYDLRGCMFPGLQRKLKCNTYISQV